MAKKDNNQNVESTENKNEKVTTKKAEATKSDTKKAETVKSDTKKAETTKSDTKKAEAAKPDAKKVEATKSDAKKTEAAKSDAKKAEATKSDAKKAETAKSDAKKAEAVKSDAKKAEAVKSDAKKAEAVKSDAKKTETVKSDVKKAEAVKSDTKKAEAFKSDAKKAEAAKLDKQTKPNAKKAKQTKTSKKSDKKKVETVKTDKQAKPAKSDTKKTETAKPAITKSEPVKLDKQDNKKELPAKSENDKVISQEQLDKIFQKKKRRNITAEETDKKPSALVSSLKHDTKTWKTIGIVAAFLLVGGFGYFAGHSTSSSNQKIAVIKKAHGANRYVRQSDINHNLNNTRYAQSIANQQLSLKVLATLYPKEYNKYTKQSQKYIKAQERQYGGAENYKQVLTANNTSESDIINNYLLTKMITVSVLHYNKITDAKLHKLYNKQDNTTYKISGVLVRSQAEADKVKDAIDNGQSYKDTKSLVKASDFAYFNRSTPDMKNALTLKELQELDTNLASGVSQMKVGQTAIIKNTSKNHFVITVVSKHKRSFKQAKLDLKTDYIKHLMLGGYGPIQSALQKDYKRAGVKVVDKTQFSGIDKVQNFYSNSGFNAGN